MAKPCTPHLIPQAEQFFEIETANVGGRGALPSRSLGVPKGIFSFAKENIPLTPPRERDEGPSPSTPHIAGLILERLHALRSVGAVYMASP